jgi:hypothetical protein
MRPPLIGSVALLMLLAACGSGDGNAGAEAANLATAEAQRNMASEPTTGAATPPAVAVNEAASESAAPAGALVMCDPQPQAQVVMTGPAGTPVFSAPVMCRDTRVAVDARPRVDGAQAVEAVPFRPGPAAGPAAEQPAPPSESRPTRFP